MQYSVIWFWTTTCVWNSAKRMITLVLLHVMYSPNWRNFYQVCWRWAFARIGFINLSILFAVHEQNKTVLNELILTIAALMVRHEFCLTVEEAGGLTFILNAMVYKSLIRNKIAQLTNVLLCRNNMPNQRDWCVKRWSCCEHWRVTIPLKIIYWKMVRRSRLMISLICIKWVALSFELAPD